MKWNHMKLALALAFLTTIAAPAQAAVTMQQIQELCGGFSDVSATVLRAKNVGASRSDVIDLIIAQSGGLADEDRATIVGMLVEVINLIYDNQTDNITTSQIRDLTYGACLSGALGQ